MIIKQKSIILCIILFILSTVPNAALSQEDMEYVDNSVFEDPKRSSAIFFHDQHNDNAGIEACSECHHVYSDGEKIQDESSEDMSCSECHKPVRFGKEMTLMKAFHKNCKGCHLKSRKGPIFCGECHKK